MHDEHSPSRRRFLGTTAAVAAAGVSGAGAVRAANPEPREFRSTAALARALRSRRITATQAVQDCLLRIDALGARSNAIARLFRDRALAEAARCDAALAAGQSPGALHGLPFTAADRFDTAAEATTLARLRVAGAILLGHSRSGEAHTSAGADVVAARGSAFDLGAAFDFPICRPAMAAGVAALQTTHGRISRAGMWPPPGGAFDVFAGLAVIAPAVEDLPLLLDELGGEDAADFATAPVPLGEARAVDPATLRVALSIDQAADSTATVRRCAQQLASAGCAVTLATPPRLPEWRALAMRYLAADGGAHVSALRREPHGTTPAPLTGEVVPSAEFTRLCEELDVIRGQQLAWISSYDLLLRPLPAAHTSNYLALPGLPVGTVRIDGDTARPNGIEIIAQPWREDVLIAALAFLEQRRGNP
jgi:amidase